MAKRRQTLSERVASNKTRTGKTKRNWNDHSQGGQTQAAINELNDPDTIYLLGGNPTYLHSRKIYFEAGYAKALSMLENFLRDVCQQVRERINQILPELDRRLKEVIGFLMGDENIPFEEFAKFWEENIEPYKNNWPEGEKAENIWLISQLYQFKIRLSKLWAITNNRQTVSGKKALIKAGILEATWGDIDGAIPKGLRLKDSAEYRDQAKQIMQKMYQKLQSLSTVINERWVDLTIQSLQTGEANAKTLMDRLLTHGEVGTIYETLRIGVERLLDSGIKMFIENVSEERQKGLGSNKGATSKEVHNPSDSRYTFTNTQGMQITLTTSDKTGAQYWLDANKSNKELTTLYDVFGASFSSAHLDYFSKQIAGGIARTNNQTEQDHWNATISYILKNTTYWNRSLTEVSETIIGIFGWLSILSKVVGAEDVQTKDMPLVTNNWGVLHSIPDILRYLLRLSAGVSDKNNKLGDLLNKNALLGFIVRQSAIVQNAAFQTPEQTEAEKKASKRKPKKQLIAAEGAEDKTKAELRAIKKQKIMANLGKVNYKWLYGEMSSVFAKMSANMNWAFSFNTRIQINYNNLITLSKGA